MDAAYDIAITSQGKPGEFILISSSVVPFSSSKETKEVKNQIAGCWPQIAVMHVKGMISVSPDSSIFPCIVCSVAQSCLTLCDPMDCSQPGFSVYGDSSGKNTGVGSLSLLQRIFLPQELNWGLLHCRQILYQLSYQGRFGSLTSQVCI